MSIPISQIVPVTLSISAMPQPTRNFGIVCLFGTSARLPSEDRIRSYADLTAVGVDFQTTDPEYLKAQVFFGQSPKPTILKIARRFPDGAAGHLNGGALVSADLTAINLVTAGGMDITVGSTLCQLSGLNFSTDATFTAVASRLQTALNSAHTGTTCTYDGSKLIITGPSLEAVTVASAPTAGGSPTAIQTILNLTAASGASVVAPLAAEATVAASLDACADKDPAFYGVMVTESEATYGDAGSLVMKAAATWAQGCGRFFTGTTMATDCKAPSGSTSSPSNFLLWAKGNSYDHVATMYSGQSGYADASLQALFATVDYSMPNSIKTAFMKELPGVLPDALSLTQVTNICGTFDGSTIGQNGNVNTTFGSLIRMAKGQVASGRFIDEIIALDWLQDSLQTGAFNVIATSPTRVPGTDAGAQKIVTGLLTGFNQARSNGLIAPGTWQGDDLGEIDTGDVLPSGYYIYASPVALQSAADRAARKAPPIAAIAIGAGALQYCAIQVNFQR